MGAFFVSNSFIHMGCHPPGPFVERSLQRRQREAEAAHNWRPVKFRALPLQLRDQPTPRVKGCPPPALVAPTTPASNGKRPTNNSSPVAKSVAAVTAIVEVSAQPLVNASNP